MATTAAYNTFLRVLQQPEAYVNQLRYTPQQIIYARRWAYYTNDIFEDRIAWTGYTNYHKLYKRLRSIYNPVDRLVDFYAETVYPGVLAVDGSKLPDGTPLAIPLAEDTNSQLKNAIGQLWQWNNWQENMTLYVRIGSALGDVFVEVVDEIDRRKVIFDIYRPERVVELDLDMTGNVKRYVLEYDIEGEDGKTYTYRKEVDEEWIAEYKDGELFQYDDNVPAERPNPYGFAPAVWCRHTNIGTDYGKPAFTKWTVLDELNSLVSHALDRNHAILNTPVMLSGKNSSTFSTAAANANKRAALTDVRGDMDQEILRVITADEGAAAAAINLPEGEVTERVDALWTSIEQAYPELTMYERLREQSQVTGPGAEIMIGDSLGRITRARAAYDTQMIKLLQMGIAIAGWRVNTGGWGRDLTSQQEVFEPFDLDSYQEGRLDFEIMPRPLVPRVLTVEERRVWIEAGEKGYVQRTTVAGKFVGNPKDEIAGVDEEQANNQPPNMDEVEAILNGAQPQPAPAPQRQPPVPPARELEA